MSNTIKAMHSPPHPGEVLKHEWMEPPGISVSELAERIGMSRPALSRVVNESAGVSPALAFKLARAFDTTPALWINLQLTYEMWHTEQEIAPEIAAIKPFKRS